MDPSLAVDLVPVEPEAVDLVDPMEHEEVNLDPVEVGPGVCPDPDPDPGSAHTAPLQLLGSPLSSGSPFARRLLLHQSQHSPPLSLNPINEDMIRRTGSDGTSNAAASSSRPRDRGITRCNSLRNVGMSSSRMMVVLMNGGAAQAAGPSSQGSSGAGSHHAQQAAADSPTRRHRISRRLSAMLDRPSISCGGSPDNTAVGDSAWSLQVADAHLRSQSFTAALHGRVGAAMAAEGEAAVRRAPASAAAATAAGRAYSSSASAAAASAAAAEGPSSDSASGFRGSAASTVHRGSAASTVHRGSAASTVHSILTVRAAAAAATAHSAATAQADAAATAAGSNNSWAADLYRSSSGVLPGALLRALAGQDSVDSVRQAVAGRGSIDLSQAGGWAPLPMVLGPGHHQQQHMMGPPALYEVAARLHFDAVTQQQVGGWVGAHACSGVIDD